LILHILFSLTHPHITDTMAKSNVLLLKSPSLDIPDPYEDSFRDYGFNPVTVPVLETVFTDLDELKQKILLGPRALGLAGVIITSARACEAWSLALKDVVQQPLAGDHRGSWSSIPFYVIGEATAAALIGETYNLGPLAPRIIRGASETGTSERLARFILHDLPASTREGTKLLYLTGDKNQDMLPSIIENERVELDYVKVYETQGSHTFGEDLTRAIRSNHAVGDHWWIVFFAPSTAEFAAPILEQSFDLPKITIPESMYMAPVRLAAIGPTTYEYLINRLHLRVAVCSPKPTAMVLAGAVSSYIMKAY
jgi:uroporphyrinogen-III synthase